MMREHEFLAKCEENPTTKNSWPRKKRNARRAYTNTHIYNSKLGKSSVWFTWDGYKSSMDGANKLLNWEFSDNTHFIIQVSCTVHPIFLQFTSKTIVYACNGSNFVRFIAHLSANEDKNRGSHSTNTLQVHLNSIALVIFLFATSFFLFFSFVLRSWYATQFHFVDRQKWHRHFL